MQFRLVKICPGCYQLCLDYHTQNMILFIECDARQTGFLLQKLPHPFGYSTIKKSIIFPIVTKTGTLPLLSVLPTKDSHQLSDQASFINTSFSQQIILPETKQGELEWFRKFAPDLSKLIKRYFCQPQLII